MLKKSVNLIIEKEKESKILHRLKILFPIIAVISLSLFIIFFLASIIYVNNNIVKYNFLKKEIENLEKKVSLQKNKEGIYKLTGSRLTVLEQLANINLSFIPLMSEIYNLDTSDIGIRTAGSDNKGNVSFAVIASSSATLDDFVSILLAKEQKKLFSQMEAHGIVRDKKGNYLLTITLKGSPTLLK